MNKLDKLYFGALKAAAKEQRSKTGKLNLYSRGETRYKAQMAFEKALGRTKAWEHGAQEAEILEGMARAVFADQWAVRKEERGHSFGGGTDIYEVAPKTPPAAKRWARVQAANLLRLNKKLPSLTRLFEVAKTAGYKRNAESFGASLGLQIVGHGVSVTDDMPAQAARMFESTFRFPRSEFYL